MFFIFGSSRSGTTLLAQCLSAHDEVVVPHQTDFIVPLMFIFDRIKDARTGRKMMVELVTKSALSTSLREFVSIDELLEVIYSTEYHPGEIVAAIYQRIARKANKRIGGDRSPNDLSYLPRLARTGVFLPGTKIIHLVRDARDVAASMYQIGSIPPTNLMVSRLWNNDNLFVHFFFEARTEMYRRFRYEDLVREPKRVLKEICAFLEIDFQEGMLSPEKRHPRYKTAKHHQEILQPISTEWIGIHQQLLTSEQRAACEFHAREGMATFGYKL